MVSINTEADGPRLYEAGEFPDGSNPSGANPDGASRNGVIRVPSTTEVLKVISRSYLDTWRHRVGRKEADRVLANAQGIGTRVHAALGEVAQGRVADVSEDIAPLVEAGEKFLALHVAEVLQVEQSMASARLGFGGTMDLYCRMNDGSHAIVDWKTSRQLTRTVGHQLAAYGLLARQRGWKVNRRIGVRLKKEKPGEFSAREFADHAGDVRVFRSCVALWWACNAQKQDALPEFDPEDSAGVEDVA